MSAKRARLSGEFKAAPDIRQNGPAAGSGYVLWSPAKVKARIGGKTEIAGSDRQQNPRRLKGLTRMARPRASLAANFRHVAANRRRVAAFCRLAARHRSWKSVSMQALGGFGAIDRARAHEIRPPVQALGRHSAIMRATGAACSAQNPAPRKALTPDMRFAQSSNINSTDKSCGKLKAIGFARFFLRQDQVFLRRRCDGPFAADPRRGPRSTRIKFIMT
jgi:hypothetical protein